MTVRFQVEGSVDYPEKSPYNSEEMSFIETTNITLLGA